MNTNNNLGTIIDSHMDTYFKAKDHANLLTGDNKTLVAQTENHIANLPEQSEMKKFINNRLDKYYETTKELGKIDSMNNADTLRQGGPTRALVPTTSSRGAFINIAILLYGVINIGIILAIAFMK